MSDKKQMIDIDKKTSMNTAISDEHQRNWNKDQLVRKVNDQTRNYDPSRIRLNFQVGRGRVIQKVDKSKNIVDKIEARIKEGVGKDKVIRSTSHRSVNIVFGGNRERMLELAFGNQNIGKSGTNLSVERKPEIEQWAKDIYDFCSREFGEGNIVSFIVHCDELNPHAHCVVVPITPDGRLSAKDLFGGKTIADAKNKLKALHTRLAEVNKCWGLDRGDDIKETGAKHVSLDEHHRRLSKENIELDEVIENKKEICLSLDKQITQRETAIKSLSTMSKNIKDKVDLYKLQLDKLTAMQEKNKITKEAYQKEKQELEQLIGDCEAKYADKQAKIELKKQELNKLMTEIDLVGVNNKPYHMLKFTHNVPQITQVQPIFGREEWLKKMNAYIRKAFSEAMRNVETTYYNNAREQVEQARQKNLVNYAEVKESRSRIDELSGKNNWLTDQFNAVLSLFAIPSLRNEVIAVAEALIGGKPIPQSSGGGGDSSSDLRWDGRRRGEEEDDYRRRCLLFACHNVYSKLLQGRKMRR